MAGDRRAPQRGHPAHQALRPARTAEAPPAQADRARPVGHGSAHRHAQRGGVPTGANLQREIEEGLNVIESWSRVNSVLFFGKSGEFASNRRDEQEPGMIALHLLQAAIVYVNTLMVQEVLELPEWRGVLAAEDRRGLTPLFWGQILPYGEVRLDMGSRLALRGPASLTTGGVDDAL